MLKDIDEKGGSRDLTELDYQDRFDERWNLYTPEEQQAITLEMDNKLNELAAAPDTLWGSIMNTSIEGGKVNPYNGTPGDWSGTPWSSIYERSSSAEDAGMFFGLLWKLRIIKHEKKWIGIRNDSDTRPTFPQRGITLRGKTYFIER